MRNYQLYLIKITSSVPSRMQMSSWPFLAAAECILDRQWQSGKNKVKHFLYLRGAMANILPSDSRNRGSAPRKILNSAIE